MSVIILIGFMGSGKSTLGKKLSKKLKVPFIDSDEEIEKLNGKSIPEIFNDDGEEEFRKLEKAFLTSLTNSNDYILSTGGGMPCFEENMDILNKLGKTFYLKLSAFELAQRLMKAKKVRPLVQDKTETELYNYIKEKLNSRIPFYEKANFTLKGKEQNVPSILQKLEF